MNKTLDKTRLRLIQHASAWAALGLLYGCNALTDVPPAEATHSFSAETNQPHSALAARFELPQAAAQRMHDENRYGVVIVVPKDRDQRFALGTTLEQAMLATEGFLSNLNRMDIPSTVRWKATLAEFVVSCVPDWETQNTAGARVLLLTPSGEVVGVAELPIESPESLIRAICELCALEPFASQRAATVDPATLQQLDHYLASGELIDEADASEPIEKYDQLVRLVDKCLPAMSSRVLSDESQVMNSLQYSIGSDIIDGLAEHKTSTPVIHGVKWTYVSYDHCPMCGMFYTPAEKRVFDTFLDE